MQSDLGKQMNTKLTTVDYKEAEKKIELFQNLKKITDAGEPVTHDLTKRKMW